MVKVYRVHMKGDPTYGPYAGHWHLWSSPNGNVHSEWNGRPPPHLAGEPFADSSTPRGDDVFFGFNSLEQARRWWDTFDCVALIEQGFVISEFDVYEGDVFAGRSQAVFFYSRATLRCSHPINILHPM